MTSIVRRAVMKLREIERLCAIFAVVLAATAAPAAEYRVGPGEAFAELDEVPWESLGAGDVVSVFWRAAPYASKWVIARHGSAEAPIRIVGVPGPGGALPHVLGAGATTRLTLDYWNEARGVVKIGGASTPNEAGASHIVIERLRITGANEENTFTDDAGQLRSYSGNAAGIFVEQGASVTIRGCELSDNGNGLFVASASSEILVERSWIHGNGNVGSQYEHNTYTEAAGMVYQFNQFGPLREGAFGNNLKDRSAGLVVRYNWIEGGNRQLDLVDSSALASLPAYAETFVYGNVLVEPDADGNRQIVHYGGDSGNEVDYRKGVLYFYNNTVASERSGRTTLFRLSTNAEYADVRNNIFHSVFATPGNIEIASDAGTFDLQSNWITQDYVVSFVPGSASVGESATLSGAGPGFSDGAGRDYRLLEESPARSAGADLAAQVLPDHDLLYEYVIHRDEAARAATQPLDLGAFEYVPEPGATAGPAALVTLLGLRRVRRRSQAHYGAA